MHAILEDTTMFRSCRRALRLLFTATPVLEAQDFFFQAEDGIRDGTVTGVQTCALPIFLDSGEVVELPAEYRGRIEITRFPSRAAFQFTAEDPDGSNSQTGCWNVAARRADRKSGV